MNQELLLKTLISTISKFCSSTAQEAAVVLDLLISFVNSIDHRKNSLNAFQYEEIVKDLEKVIKKVSTYKETSLTESKNANSQS